MVLPACHVAIHTEPRIPLADGENIVSVFFKILIVSKEIKEKEFLPCETLPEGMPAMLQSSQDTLLERALSFRETHTNEISSWEDLCAYFTPATKGRPEIHGGFALGHWAGGVEDEKRLKDELKVTVRCIPDDPSLRGGPGICIVTGKPAEGRVVFAKSY